MLGLRVVKSNDFAENTTVANLFDHMTLAIADTKKNATYDLNRQLKEIRLLEESELLANSAKAQRFATDILAGSMLFSAGVVPSLATLLIGHNLPEKTKYEYLIFLKFIDDKCAILQANQKHHDKLKKFL